MKDRPDRTKMVTHLGMITAKELKDTFPTHRDLPLEESYLCWEILQDKPGAWLDHREFIEQVRKNDHISLRVKTDKEEEINIDSMVAGVKIHPFKSSEFGAAIFSMSDEFRLHLVRLASTSVE